LLEGQLRARFFALIPCFFENYMPLNLISDSWIPVRLKDGSRRTIAPHQMTDPEIAAPDWPRADLNLACYELLIGMVFMATPPEDDFSWEGGRPDPVRLQERLAEYASAFSLLGDGPKFLQDLEDLPGAPSGPDLLFVDSAGGNTAKNNADLMVHRDRYAALDLPLAAMALYAFQQFAPSGGAGNRTSMRGGGPLVTLADPGTGLWDLVWANVPCGRPANPGDLPWMRPTRTSQEDQSVGAGQAHPVEAFFGMPRRLRLVAEPDRVTGVVQRPYGTNYGLWRHPLSPYYRLKEGAELLPRHPATGRLPWRNWIGIVLSDPKQESGLRLRAACIEGFYERYGRQAKRMIAAGWAMDNMKPKDFLWAELPLLTFDAAAQRQAESMIGAAETVASALRRALTALVAEGSARDAEYEQFWSATEGDFLDALAVLSAPDFDAADISQKFLGALGRQALAQFDALALPGLYWKKFPNIEDKKKKATGVLKIVEERTTLMALVYGRSKQGKSLWAGLDVVPPERATQREVMT
tara:strand:+ start:1440 stop:3014 length:1575 start_codon:yes stop_codon:yes gene_type:complete